MNKKNIVLFGTLCSLISDYSQFTKNRSWKRRRKRKDPLAIAYAHLTHLVENSEELIYSKTNTDTWEYAKVADIIDERATAYGISRLNEIERTCYYAFVMHIYFDKYADSFFKQDFKPVLSASKKVIDSQRFGQRQLKVMMLATGTMVNLLKDLSV
jgi:hypothetical protein